MSSFQPQFWMNSIPGIRFLDYQETKGGIIRYSSPPLKKLGGTRPPHPPHPPQDRRPCQYVPILKTLKALLNQPDVLTEVSVLYVPIRIYNYCTYTSRYQLGF